MPAHINVVSATAASCTPVQSLKLGVDPTQPVREMLLAKSQLQRKMY